MFWPPHATRRYTWGPSRARGTSLGRCASLGGEDGANYLLYATCGCLDS